MEIGGPFYINGRCFSKEELIEFAEEKVALHKNESWEFKLYRFIQDFLDIDTEIVQYTSGTTGDAKGILLERSAMFSSALRSITYFGLKSGDSVLLCLSVDYIAGKMMVVRAFSGGLNLVTLEPSGNPLKKLTRRIDFAAMVPIQVHKALESGSDFGKIRKLIIGGGSLSIVDRELLRSLNDCEVFETFGMTETYTHIAVKKINGEDAETVFSLLQGVKIGLDTRDCLFIELPGIEKIVTNDLVKMHSAETFSWLGRIDNVINSGGIKFIPEVLEEKIRMVIPYEVMLLGRDDENLGERLVLLIEGEEDAELMEEWKNRLEGVLGKYEMPREWVFVKEFDRTGSGKVKRV